MDSDIDCIVANLNFEDKNNYITWNHLTAQTDKLTI